MFMPPIPPSFLMIFSLMSFLLFNCNPKKDGRIHVDGSHAVRNF